MERCENIAKRILLSKKKFNKVNSTIDHPLNKSKRQKLPTNFLAMSFEINIQLNRKKIAFNS